MKTENPKIEEENKLRQFLNRNPFESQEFDDLYRELMTIPPDFKPTDPDRIKIFSSRLKQARENAQIPDYMPWSKQGMGPRDCYVFTQKQAAQWLGVTVARISQYESGNIKAIPMKYLPSFYDMYDVTPHYLLGYTSEPDKVIAMDKNPDHKITFGQLIKDKDDKNKYAEFVLPMTHPVLSEHQSTRLLSALGWVNSGWFYTLSQFLRCSDETLKTGFALLQTLVNLEQNQNENGN